MRKIDIEQLKSDAETIISNVINNDDFCKIETGEGIAVVINEHEWNLLKESLKMHLNTLN